MKNENEINDETKQALEISLCALLLESSRRYSALADAVFKFSVEQSHFASMISGQRMTLAKAVVQKQIDVMITLEGEALKIYQCHGQIDVTQEMLEDCLYLDEVLQIVLEKDDQNVWEPIILGIQATARKCEIFLKEIADGRGESNAWQCQNCGALKFTTGQPENCSICGSQNNWMVAVELNQGDGE